MAGLDLSKHFSLTSSVDVSQICDEILKTLGITYFNFIKVYNHDGSRELLTNNSPWIEHFYKNELYKSLGAVDVEHLLPKGYFLWSELDSKDPVYLQGRESFNIDNGITFVIKREDVTYLYIFASSRENYQITNFYARNIDLFKRFILYFREKASSLINMAAKNRIYLPDKQPIYDNSIKKIELSQFDRAQFYKETDIEKFYLLTESDDVFLTKKQAECASLLIAGATAKQTAKLLGISHRTVEEHLSLLKKKFNYLAGKSLSKQELIGYLELTWVHDIIFSEKINFNGG